MSNYIEYNNKIAFHPGYYIKEIVDESGLTQEDFAKRLDTTPKNLSLLIRGEQSLSIDIAMKLSRLIGTSVNYWLNLQNAYDALIAEFHPDCTEMEGASIAQAATLNNIPYVVIRAISDKADGSAQEDYPTFEKKAAEHCAKLVQEMMKEL